MAWAANSKSKIILALLYRFDRDGLLWVGTAMDVIEKLPAPINQQAINEIELLLSQFDAINAEVAAMAAKAGLIRLDVIEWSDKPGQIMAGVYQQRESLRGRISSALGLSIYVDKPAVSGSGNTLSRS